MTSYRDRQRAAARARLEKGMAERAESARRRKKIKTLIAASATFVVLVGAGVLITVLVTDDDGKKNPTASASTQACGYQPLVDPQVSGAPQPLPSTIHKVGAPPESSVSRTGVQLMTLNTSQGAVRIRLDTAKVPCNAASFTYLAGKKFFDNTRCHRLLVDGIYALQCGDPSGTSAGGPDYRTKDENLPVGKNPAYPAGTVAMANGGANTNGSQFFIVYADSTLDPSYSVIGYVLQGLDIINRVAEGGVIPKDPQNPSEGTPKIEVLINSLTVDKPAASLPKLPPASPVPPAGPATSATSQPSTTAPAA